MAPAGAKRRRLNGNTGTSLYKSSNGAASRMRNAAVAHPLETHEDRSSEHDSDDEEEARQQAAGASYGALLSSLQRSNSQHRGKGIPRSSNKPVKKIHKDESFTVVDVHNKEAVAGRNEDEIYQAEAATSEEEDAVDDDAGEIDPVAAAADDDQDDSDAFETHFANPDDNELARRLQAVKARQWNISQTQASIGKQTVMVPAATADTQLATLPPITSLNQIQLKQRLVDPCAKVLSKKFDAVQSALLPPLLNYRDVLYCGRTPQNAETLRSLACLHALNHIFKTRDRIIKNTTKFSKSQGDVDLECRDQGFTRPKVLILLETRHACSRYMDVITKLCDPEQQENKKRFQDAFVQSEATLSEDKPLDFRELFEGNDDNEFRLGIKFTRKTMKYFSQFYSSDIIVASPLGLRRAVNADDPRKTDYDFLSSIEMVIVDQADAMLMQNWEHVEFVFEHLNLQPKQPHDCDFSRVRNWYLDQAARYLRQTVVFSAFLTPELNGVFSSYMQNVAGKTKLVPEYGGVIQDVGLQIRQTFYRFRSKSPASDPDDRFKYFTTTVVPQLVRQADPATQGLGALIFIPSYLDFVRVRNYFSTSQDVRNLTFGSLSEYTDVPSSRRGRAHFFSGRQSVMLYTGRAHHFRRYQVRGVKRVILYSLPENPIFFNEIAAGFLASSIADGKLSPEEASVQIMFSRWDSLALERVVGSKRAGRMLNESSGDTFEFK